MAISIQRLDLVPVDEESRPAAERPENRSRGVSHHPINPQACELPHIHPRSSLQYPSQRDQNDRTCEAHTHMADDRHCSDRRIAGDHRGRDRDWDRSLAKTLLP
jgi:hypothetical protein